MKVPPYVSGVTVVAMLSLAAGLRAVELPMTSPFLPASGAPSAAAPVADAGGIELRGVIQTPVGPLFSIYSTTRRKSAFVGLNETGSWGPGGGTFVVRNHNQVGGQDQVTIEFQGRASTLVTKKSKVGLTARAGANLPAPAIVPTPALTQTVTLNPTPESEALRMQAVTDEIARRREARAQGDAAGAAAPAAPPARAGTP